MKLGDVLGMSAVVAVDQLASDPLWSRTSANMTPTDIQLFYARAGLQGLRQEAIDTIDRAQAVVVKELFAGSLPRGSFSALVLHEAPARPYMADEFVDGLIKLRKERRGACLYALEHALDPADVTELTWNKLKLDEQPATCMEIINAARAGRHMRLPYVFWEWSTPNIAGPLMGLQLSIEEAFGCKIAELQTKYKRMILIHRGAEAASFMSLAKQLARDN
jgi:hypothetical protein